MKARWKTRDYALWAAVAGVLGWRISIGTVPALGWALIVLAVCLGAVAVIRLGTERE